MACETDMMRDLYGRGYMGADMQASVLEQKIQPEWQVLRVWI
jgi:hypothetical protein